MSPPAHSVVNPLAHHECVRTHTLRPQTECGCPHPLTALSAHQLEMPEKTQPTQHKCVGTRTLRPPNGVRVSPPAYSLVNPPAHHKCVRTRTLRSPTECGCPHPLTALSAHQLEMPEKTQPTQHKCVGTRTLRPTTECGCPHPLPALPAHRSKNQAAYSIRRARSLSHSVNISGANSLGLRRIYRTTRT